MPNVLAACAVCGKAFVKQKSHGKYCSPQCGRKGAPSEARINVECSVCGAQMTQRSRYVGKRPPICSTECQTQAKRSRNLRRRSELPADHPARWILGQWSMPLRFYQCIDCGSLACHNQSSAKRCRTCRIRHDTPLRYARFIAAMCHCCGTPFLLDRKQFHNLQVGQVCCSRKCSRKLHKYRRRARKKQAFVENVSPAYIYERDGFKCQICGRRLAMAQAKTLGTKNPHPNAPTLDHIVPLAMGGTHEPSNVQAAHYACNCRKSTDAMDDQLLLMG